MPFLEEYDGDYFLSAAGRPIGPSLNQQDALTVRRWLFGTDSGGTPTLVALWHAFEDALTGSEWHARVERLRQDADAPPPG